MHKNLISIVLCNLFHIRGDIQIQFTIHFRFKCQQTQSKAMHCPCKRNDFKMRGLWVYERQCLSFLREQESMDWWREGHRVKHPDVLVLARLDDTYLGVPELQVCGLKYLILDRLNSGSAGDILTVFARYL